MTKLRLKTALGFSIGDVGGNLYFSIIGFIFIFYLTEQLGLSGTLAGSAMLIGKIWDAITDPIVSSISDRCKSKFGRRRPFIFWGALLLAVAMVLMFSMPLFESNTKTFIMATALFCLLGTGYTLVNIPYCSLQPELTNDYHEQTKLTSIRMGFAILGTLLAVTARPIAENIGIENNGWTIMAIIMGSIMLLTSWVTVFTVKENTHIFSKDQKSVRDSYKEALLNREFLYALIPWTLFVTSITITQGSFLYYFKYIFNQQSMFELALFGLIIMSLICLPLWVKISKSMSKGSSYILGMGLFSLGLLVSYLLSPIFGTLFSVIVITISGIGFSTHYIMPHTMIPDIIELDSVRTGIRREGVYYGIWNFLMKCGQGLAGLLIGVTLDIVDFIPPETPNDVVIQSQKTLDGIALLCGPIPIILIVIGMLILKKYPINKSYYNTELKLISNKVNKPK